MFTYNVLKDLDCYRMQRMATGIIREKIKDIKWSKLSMLEATCKLPWEISEIEAELVLDGQPMRLHLVIKIDPSRWFSRSEKLTEEEKIKYEVEHYLAMISNYLDGSEWKTNCYDIVNDVMLVTCVNPRTYKNSRDLNKQLDAIIWGPKDE